MEDGTVKKTYWEITYYDKRLGKRVRYMKMGFPTEKAAQDELARIQRRHKDPKGAITLQYRSSYKIDPINVFIREDLMSE